MESLTSFKTQSWLTWFLKGLLILGVVLLLGRLAELQIVKGSYFKGLAEGNRIKHIPIIAQRGQILDRGGEVLAGNKSISDDAQDEVINEWMREYIYGPTVAHVVGYLGEVGEDEVGKIDAKCPAKGVRRIQSLTGRSGLEEEYNCTLRGVDGEELVEVDTLGNHIRLLGNRDPVSGLSIKTTIDLRLQKKIAEVMDQKGAVVATTIDGQVLALYSYPTFDNNIFIKQDFDSIAQKGNILNNAELPLFNRAISGTYPPGSVYKIVTAVAALEEKVIDENFTYRDEGVITINDFSYSNWYFTQYGGKEGEIDLTRAIARSTDTFFYEIGGALGVEKLAAWSYNFGLGEKTGIDIPGEVLGLIPSSKWKEDVIGERWFLGNTYHMAIGQGYLTLSPLATHTIAATIASGGKYCQPHLLLGTSANCRDLGIKRKTLREVKKGMIAACEEEGTGVPFFDFSEIVGCKTGTSEIGEKDETHAWFTVFAPADFPEIVLTVLVEKGGEGSKVAAPIARDILDFWFGNTTDEG